MNPLRPLAALLCLLACACGSGPEPPAGAKVLLIGIDGCEWNLVRPLMEAGRMPNLARLVARGASGELHSLEGEGEHSATLWTCIATGKLPAKHGIDHVIYFPEGAYTRAPRNASHRKSAAIWEIASALGKPVVSIFYFLTWPPDAVDGILVSDMALDPSVEPKAWPEEWSRGMSAYARDYLAPLYILPEPVVGELIRGDDWAEEDLRRLSGEFANWFRTVRKDAYALKLLEQAGAEVPDARLRIVYFQGADHFQHFFWRFFEPAGFEVEEQAVAAFGEVIPRYLEVLDGYIGRLVDAAGDDTVVALVSDHGFRKRIRRYETDLDRLLRVMGLLNRTRGTLMPASTRVFDYQTRPTKTVRALRINLAGREEQGVVAAADFEAERERILAALRAVRTKSGQPVFAELRATRPGERGDILAAWAEVEALAPDTFLVDGQEYPGSRFLKLQTRSGDHRPYGMLVLSGPGVRAGVELQGAEIVDVAPTLLYLLGLPVARDMDGRVLEAALTPEQLAAAPVRATDSLDWCRAVPGEAGAGEEARERLLEQLRSLGYVK